MRRGLRLDDRAEEEADDPAHDRTDDQDQPEAAAESAAVLPQRHEADGDQPELQQRRDDRHDRPCDDADQHVVCSPHQA